MGQTPRSSPRRWRVRPIDYRGPAPRIFQRFDAAQKAAGQMAQQWPGPVILEPLHRLYGEGPRFCYERDPNGQVRVRSL